MVRSLADRTFQLRTELGVELRVAEQQLRRHPGSGVRGGEERWAARPVVGLGEDLAGAGRLGEN